MQTHRTYRDSLKLVFDARDLPDQITHWSMRTKHLIVLAIEDGTMTPAEVSKRWGVPCEELAAWQRKLAKHGPKGLRSTRCQEYRAT